MADESMDEIAARDGLTREGAYLAAMAEAPLRRAGDPEEIAACCAFLGERRVVVRDGRVVDRGRWIHRRRRGEPGVRARPLGPGAMMLALDDLEAAGFRTVIVTSSDVSGRLVGKRFSLDVFRPDWSKRAWPTAGGLRWDVDEWPGPQGITGHQPVARRPAGPGPGHAASGRVARRDRDLRGRLRRDRPRRPGDGRAADDPSAGRSSTSRTRGSRRRSPPSWSRSIAGRTTMGGRTGTRRCNRPRSRAPTTRCRPGASTSRSSAASTRRSRPPTSGPWTSQVESGVRPVEMNLEYQRAGDGRPPHPVQARDARHGGRRGDVGHVHAQAVRRHDRVVVPPAPVAPERERRERVP